MNKNEFLSRLCISISCLPKEEIEERLNFYSEMIDDYIEEGYYEEEAISKIGTVENVTAQILEDTPITKLLKEKIKPKKKLGILEILLLVLGAPIWLSVLIAVLAVVFSVYVSFWSVIISLWSVFVSFVACTFGGIVATVIFAFSGYGFTAVAMLAAAFVCAGLSIFMFYICKAATKGYLILTKKIVKSIKNSFAKKGEV